MYRKGVFDLTLTDTVTTSVSAIRENGSCGVIDSLYHGSMSGFILLSNLIWLVLVYGIKYEVRWTFASLLWGRGRLNWEAELNKPHHDQMVR